MTNGSLAVYDDGKLLHTCLIVSVRGPDAVVRIMRTARPDKVMTVKVSTLTPIVKNTKKA